MKSVFLHFLLVSFFTQACLAQVDETAQADESDGTKMVVHQVLPSDTDKSIDKWSGQSGGGGVAWMHWTYFNSSVPERHQLLVFLAGTGGHGKGHKAFNKLAANEGFHVVSPAYPSEISISHINGSLKKSDPDSFLKARENIIYGKAPYPGFDINEANSIYNRLLKLLQYLAKTYPQENWNQYLAADGSLEWGKFIFAGQSQGGGHAAVLGMQHKVARVLMFGSPKDHLHDQPAKWYSGPSATPLDRFFSFVHSADEHNGATYPQQLENYRAMKLMPKYQVINVDEMHAPYEHSRLLTSKRHQDGPHEAPLLDTGYKEAWKYMLEEPVQ